MRRRNVRLIAGQFHKKALTRLSSMSKAPKSKSGPIKTPDGTRVFARPEYRSFRLSSRIKHPKPTVVGSFRLFKRSLGVLKLRLGLFLGISLVYLLLSVILVKGFGNSVDVQAIKDVVAELFQGGFSGTMASGVTVFGALLSSAGSAPTDVAGAYQAMLLLTVSLAFIWALRQTLAGNQVRIRDAFYKGTAQIVPFMLVLIVVGLQLLPVVVASLLYALVYGDGLAATALEQVLWALLIMLFVLWSLYMIASSVFALYIVALPDMTPIKALRSARGLVRYRRWTIMRRIIFLPIWLVVVLGVVMLPIITFMAPAAEWIFFLLTTLCLMIVHSYMYNLYRELIK